MESFRIGDPHALGPAKGWFCACAVRLYKLQLMASHRVFAEPAVRGPKPLGSPILKPFNSSGAGTAAERYGIGLLKL